MNSSSILAEQNIITLFEKLEKYVEERESHELSSDEEKQAESIIESIKSSVYSIDRRFNQRKWA